MRLSWEKQRSARRDGRRTNAGHGRRLIFCTRNRTDPISGFAKNGDAPGGHKALRLKSKEVCTGALKNSRRPCGARMLRHFQACRCWKNVSEAKIAFSLRGLENCKVPTNNRVTGHSFDRSCSQAAFRHSFSLPSRGGASVLPDVEVRFSPSSTWAVSATPTGIGSWNFQGHLESFKVLYKITRLGQDVPVDGPSRTDGDVAHGYTPTPWSQARSS